MFFFWVFKSAKNLIKHKDMEEKYKGRRNQEALLYSEWLSKHPFVLNNSWPLRKLALENDMHSLLFSI